MIGCEEFERDYQSWQSGSMNSAMAEAMHQHTVDCVHCRAWETNTSSLRRLLKGQPVLNPGRDFEARLHQRIVRDRTTTTVTSTMLPSYAPRWAALGAGLVTGLAIGGILLMPSQVDKSDVSSVSVQGILASQDAHSRAIGDSLADRKDSLEADNSHYDMNRNSQMVSGRR